MKQIISIAILCVVTIGLFAQTVSDPIGVGSANSFAPVYNGFYFSVSQQIYTQSELATIGLGSGGIITHLAFQAGSAGVPLSQMQSWLIYLGVTEVETFGSALYIDSWLPLSGMTQVFRGSIGQTGTLAANNWLTIGLQEAFIYDGVGNLVVFVNEYDPSYPSGTGKFRGTDLGEGVTRTLYGGADVRPFIPEGTGTWNSSYWESPIDTSIRPNLRLTYTAPSSEPDLAVTAFNGPALIPNDTRIQITIMNMSTITATAGSYTITISEVAAPSDILLATISETVTIAGSSFSTYTYNIEPSAYNSWPFTSQTATPVTLKATVVIAGDAVPANNTQTLATNLRPVYDLQLATTIPSFLGIGVPMEVIVQNNGRSAISQGSFQVDFFENNTIIYTINGTDASAIPIGTFQAFPIPLATLLQATQGSQANLKIQITDLTSADSIPANNTAIGNAYVFETIVEVGISGTETANIIPFSTFWNDNLAQVIYTAEELGSNPLIITHINYKYTVGQPYDDPPNPYPVSIYMANYEKASFTTNNDFVPGDVFEQVVSNYNLPVQTQGVFEGIIPLTTPFEYMGNGLIVMTFKDHESWGGTIEYFQGPTVANSNVSINKRRENSGAVFDPADPTQGGNGIRYHYKPQTRFGATAVQAAQGFDLAVMEVIGTSIIPGNDPIEVFVMNRGVNSVTSTDYTIDIYEVVPETTDHLLYTIPTAEMEELPGDQWALYIYSISAEVYNLWAFVSPNAGQVTLKATVSCSGVDLDESNNSGTLVTNLRPLYDIAVLGVSGAGQIPTTNPLGITLLNNGRSPITQGSYSVNISVNGTPLYSIADESALTIGLASEVVLTVPSADINHLLTSTTGNFSFNIQIVSLVEESVTTNNSGTHASTVFSGGFETDGIAEVGIAGTASDHTLPFALYHRDNLAQSIYSAVSLGDAGEGVITHINYKVTITDTQAVQTPYNVNIHMANYDKEAFISDSDWVPGDAFTCVAADYDLPIHSTGTYDFWIELDTPFYYTGGDLVVMTFKDHTYYTANTNVFFLSPHTQQYVSLWKRTDATAGTNYNPNNPSQGGVGSRAYYLPQTRFAFTRQGYGVVSGLVTDGSEPIEGAVISVEGTPSVVTTGADGMYEILVETASEAQLLVAAVGKVPQQQAISSLDWSDNNGLQRAEWNVTLQPATTVTVAGTVIFADSGEGVSGATVVIGQFSGLTNADGVYSISGVFADAGYEVSLDASTYMGFADYADELYIDYSQVQDDLITMDIVLEEAQRLPLYTHAKLNTEGLPVVGWFNPYTSNEPFSFSQCPNDGYQYSYGNASDTFFIAAHRYTAANLSSLGVVGAYLMKIAFVPTSSVNTFTINIWVGANLAAPDVDSPTYSQFIAQTLVALALNEIPLTIPIHIPAGAELVIGIRSTGTQVRTRDSGFAGFNDGFGNKYYFDYGWTTINEVEPIVADNWQIRGYAFTTVTSEGGMRAFGDKYKVYRLAEGTAFETATMLTSTPITVGTSGLLLYEDVSAIPTGNYQYAVTSVYTGSNYPGDEHYIESLPAFSNVVSVVVPLSVSGVLQVVEGESAIGLTVSLINLAPGGEPSPESVVSAVGGEFTFGEVLPGEYTLTVSRYSTVMNETYTYTHPETIVVETENVTGIAVNVPISLSNDDCVILPVTMLRGNYPNPFNPTTTILFDIRNKEQVLIEIYNIKGQRIKTLVNDVFTTGSYRVVWNGDDDSGRNVGSGVYFYKWRAGEYSSVRKMVMVK